MVLASLQIAQEQKNINILTRKATKYRRQESYVYQLLDRIFQ